MSLFSYLALDDCVQQPNEILANPNLGYLAKIDTEYLRIVQSQRNTASLLAIVHMETDTQTRTHARTHTHTQRAQIDTAHCFCWPVRGTCVCLIV